MIPGPSVESTNDSESVKSTHISHRGVEDSTEHVYLCSSDVSLVLIVNSVLIEPVVNVSLEVNVISEVSRSGRCHEEAVFIGD